MQPALGAPGPRRPPGACDLRGCDAHDGFRAALCKISTSARDAPGPPLRSPGNSVASGARRLRAPRGVAARAARELLGADRVVARRHTPRGRRAVRRGLPIRARPGVQRGGPRATRAHRAHGDPAVALGPALAARSLAVLLHADAHGHACRRAGRLLGLRIADRRVGRRAADAAARTET
jgi:hypothetical protein